MSAKQTVIEIHYHATPIRYPKQAVTQRDVDEVFELFCQGHTQKEIIAITGIPRGTVLRIYREHKFGDKWKELVEPFYLDAKVAVSEVAFKLLERWKSIAEDPDSPTRALNLASEAIGKVYDTLEKIYNPKSMEGGKLGPQGNYDTKEVLQILLDKKKEKK